MPSGELYRAYDEFLRKNRDIFELLDEICKLHDSLKEQKVKVRDLTFSLKPLRTSRATIHFVEKGAYSTWTYKVTVYRWIRFYKKRYEMGPEELFSFLKEPENLEAFSKVVEEEKVNALLELREFWRWQIPYEGCWEIPAKYPSRLEFNWEQKRCDTPWASFDDPRVVLRMDLNPNSLREWLKKEKLKFEKLLSEREKKLKKFREKYAHLLVLSKLM